MALRVASAVFTGYMVCPDPKTQGWLKNGFRLILGKTFQIIKHIIYRLISLTYKYASRCSLAESPIFLCSDLKRNRVWVRRWERDAWKLGLFWFTLRVALWQVLHFWSAFIRRPSVVCCLPPHALKVWVDLRSPGWLHRGLTLPLALPPVLWIADACDHAPLILDGQPAVVFFHR